MNHHLIFNDIGFIEYQKAFDLQESFLNELVNIKLTNQDLPDSLKKTITNQLLFCEHPHVFTLGKSGSEKNLFLNSEQLEAKKISYLKTNRGGDITYHGPGQLVGYPIFDLDSLNIGIRQYVHLLEEAIILTLNHYKIKGQRLKGATGIWLDVEKENRTRKICAIGVRVSRGVTMHGFAFNINTDLNYFSYINPCGFTDKAVTSLEKELNGKQNMEEVKTYVKQNLLKVFNLETI